MMKLNLKIVYRLWIVAIVQLIFSLSASALEQFPADAKFYSSTQFSVSGNVDRTLHYQSNQGTQYVFNENANGVKLTGLTQGANNLFAANVSANKYSHEKQLLVSGTLDQIKSLKVDLADLAKEIQEVQESIQAAQVQEEKSKIIHEQRSPLEKQRDQVNTKIKRLEREVQAMDRKPVLSLFDLYRNRPIGEVLLHHNQTLYLLSTNKRSVRSESPVAKQSLSATNYVYANLAYVKAGARSATNGRSDALFILEVIRNTVTGYEFNGEKYRLMRIEDQSVRDLVSMAKVTPTTPSSFEFKGDVLTTVYQWNKSNGGAKSLLVEYKESGKKKNLIQVRTEAETQVYDPKTPSANIEKHIGVLAATKSGSLLELKKVQKTNDKVDGGWAFDYKKRLIKLGEEVLFVEKENYYGFEGLWYLAHWMSSQSIPSQKVFLINGLESISLTATLKANAVEITKAGKVLYRFTLDRASFVTKFEFVPMDQTLTLISKDTETTKKNRQKLNAFMQANGVIKL